MLADHAKAIHRVCFGADPSESDLALLGSRERWLIYRDLVRNRLSAVVDAALGRTKQALGEEAFSRAFDDWLAGGGPKTRYLRHVPRELAELALPIWEATEAPYVADLARYEIAAWTVRHAPPNPTAVGDFGFDRRPVIGAAVELLRLDHRVHEPRQPEPELAPERVHLCVYRNAFHRAQSYELNALAADLLEAWKRGDQTVAQSVQRTAAMHGTDVGPAFVEKLSAMIADFIERGIIVGGAATQ